MAYTAPLFHQPAESACPIEHFVGWPFMEMQGNVWCGGFHVRKGACESAKVRECEGARVQGCKSARVQGCEPHPLPLSGGEGGKYESARRRDSLRKHQYHSSSHLRSAMNRHRKRIAILASGSGTNAQRLIEYFKESPLAEVVLVGCDQPKAGVLQRAWDLGVPSYLFNGKELREGGVLKELKALHVDVVVLAGFLRLIPTEMVRAYDGRIINIHPALLPKYGGKGMYGANVHKAVIASGDKVSGITIHLVNEHYDEGEHLLQVECPVRSEDTPESLAARIHRLEHEHFPKAVECLIQGLDRSGI
jgi:phosphoribosylglycinamide formyltransferase 1